MASDRWHRKWASVPAGLRRLVWAACISCWILQVPDSVDFAFAGEQQAGGASAKDAAVEKSREDRLDHMREGIQRTNVYRLQDGAPVRAKPLAEPVLRYSEHRVPVLDGSLWVWAAQGRPVALEKIEIYPGDKWVHCLASVSDGLVQADWPDGRRWSSKKAGLDVRSLPDAPRPIDSQTGRLVQMRNLARRFFSTISDPVLGWEENQRLLSRPVHRYSDPDSALLDGAIFAFLTAGTNPDLLLLVELHGKDLSESVWKYGLVRMTNRQLAVRLDEREVWRVPLILPNKKTFDTWLYFYESRRAG